MAGVTRRKSKAAPEPVVEEVVEEIEELEEDEDFEELDDDADEDTDEADEDEATDEDEDDLEEIEEVEEEPEPAPKTRGKKATAAKKTTTAKAAAKTEGSGNDSAWLAAHVSEQTGKPVDARALRVLLRKMAKEGVIERVVGTDRARYDWPDGAKDPVVKDVVKRVKDGALERAKNDGLAAARAAKEAKKAAKDTETTEVPAKKTVKKTTTAKATPAKATATPAKATKKARAKA